MYELLKQLKEVGYPQPQWTMKSQVEGIKGLVHKGLDDNDVYEPTTDELIEELGDDLKILNHGLQDRVGWYAITASPKFLSGYGPTPKEALIKLYIELHKK